MNAVMNVHVTSSAPRMRYFFGMISWFLFLATLACLAFAAPLPLSAQEEVVQATEKGIITLIPTEVQPSDLNLKISATEQNDPDQTVLLRFETASLPPGAVISAAHLSLFAMTPTMESQTVQVYAVEHGAKNQLVSPQNPANTDWTDLLTDCNIPPDKPIIFGAISLPPDPNGSAAANERVYALASPGFICALNKAGDKAFSLLLQTKEHIAEDSQWIWASDKAESSRQQPRLILEYTMATEPALTQSDGLPAVHSRRPFSPTGARAANDHQELTVAATFTEAWSYTPAFYNNLVHLIIKPDRQLALQAFSPIGNPLWPQPLALDLGEIPGRQHLLVSKVGRLYIIGDNGIFVYQLDREEPTAAPQMVASWHKKTPLSLEVAPTLGPDGSLYFVSVEEVYGLNPDMQELWRVMLNPEGIKTSPVTVGPSGRFAYLTAKNEGLVTIDVQTGERETITLTNQTDLQSVDIPTLHAPVVVRRPDGAEQIYVAANAANDDGVLDLFVKPIPAIAADNAELRQSNVITGWSSPPTGRFGQPILDQLPPHIPSDPVHEPNPAKKVYAVRVQDGQAELIAIDWESGATKSASLTLPVTLTSPVTTTSSVSATATVTSTPTPTPYQLRGGNLVMDKDGNLYVWYGTGSTAALYAFDASLARPEPLALPGSGISAQAQLYFGDDGTLYANSVNDLVLRAIAPRYRLNRDSGADIYSPTHLGVDGVVYTNTTLSAGGNIMLGKGFTVRQGAMLTVTTNVTEVVTSTLGAGP